MAIPQIFRLFGASLNLGPRALSVSSPGPAPPAPPSQPKQPEADCPQPPPERCIQPPSTPIELSSHSVKVSSDAFAGAGPGQTLSGKSTAKALHSTAKLNSKCDNLHSRTKRGAAAINALRDPERQIRPRPVAKAVGAALRRQAMNERKKALLARHFGTENDARRLSDEGEERLAGSRKRALVEDDDPALVDEQPRKNKRSVSFKQPLQTVIHYENEYGPRSLRPALALPSFKRRSPFRPAKHFVPPPPCEGEQSEYPSPPTSPPSSSPNTFSPHRSSKIGHQGSVMGQTVAAMLIGRGAPFLGAAEGAAGSGLDRLLGEWVENWWGAE